MIPVDDSIPIYVFPDGWHIAELVSRFDYLREGEQMGNCAGQFFCGPCTIYSLRDRRGRSRASILFDGSMIDEVAGRANTPLKLKHRLRVRQFLTDRGYRVHPLAFLRPHIARLQRHAAALQQARISEAS